MPAKNTARNSGDDPRARWATITAVLVLLFLHVPIWVIFSTPLPRTWRPSPSRCPASRSSGGRALARTDFWTALWLSVRGNRRHRCRLVLGTLAAAAVPQPLFWS